MSAHGYVEENGLDAMLVAKTSAGVAPEVTRDTHSGLETQMRHHQMSKTGVSVAQQKGIMSSKLFLKINHNFELVCLHTVTSPRNIHTV